MPVMLYGCDILFLPDTKLTGVRMGIVTEFCKSVVTFRVIVLPWRELFY